MNPKPHNNYCQLVSMTIPTEKGTVELVYGQKNGGGDEGLEAYYLRHNELHHYLSFRWSEAKVPMKYMREYEILKANVVNCPHGHKIELDQ